MAGLIGTQPTSLNEIILAEPDPRYSRKLVSVTVPDGGLSLGTVLAVADDVYSIVASDTVANATAILVDSRVIDEDYTTAGTYDLVAIVYGTGVIASQNKLDFGDLSDTEDSDGDSEVNTAVEALMTNSGIRADYQTM